MSSVIIAGDTSGTVTIAAPAVAGTPTLTLPTTTGTILTTTGGVTPGTAGNLLTSNGTAWTSTAPAASGPVLKIVTDTTDIAVTADAPTQTLVGSSFSVSIPTSGVIRIASFAGRVIKGAGTGACAQTWGIRIGSTNYWFSLVNKNGTLGYMPATIASVSANGDYDQFYGTFDITSYNYMWQTGIDIVNQSVPTGTQTVQLIAAKAFYAGNPWTDPWTLKGTVITTRVGLEFVSAS